MKKWLTVICMMLALCVFASPVWAAAEDAEGWEYEEDYEYEGDAPLAPEIELVSNPSTGYRWFFDCDDPEVVEVTEHGFISGNEEMLGAAGKECFRLNGYEQGMAVVTFRYARSAEEKPLYTITYQVQVGDSYAAEIFQTSFEMN